MAVAAAYSTGITPSIPTTTIPPVASIGRTSVRIPGATATRANANAAAVGSTAGSHCPAECATGDVVASTRADVAEPPATKLHQCPSS